jgi:hypothetical protein
MDEYLKTLISNPKLMEDFIARHGREALANPTLVKQFIQQEGVRILTDKATSAIKDKALGQIPFYDKYKKARDLYRAVRTVTRVGARGAEVAEAGATLAITGGITAGTTAAESYGRFDTARSELDKHLPEARDRVAADLIAGGSYTRYGVDTNTAYRIMEQEASLLGTGLVRASAPGLYGRLMSRAQSLRMGPDEVLSALSTDGSAAARQRLFGVNFGNLQGNALAQAMAQNLAKLPERPVYRPLEPANDQDTWRAITTATDEGLTCYGIGFRQYLLERQMGYGFEGGPLYRMFQTGSLEQHDPLHPRETTITSRVDPIPHIATSIFHPLSFRYLRWAGVKPNDPERLALYQRNERTRTGREAAQAAARQDEERRRADWDAGRRRIQENRVVSERLHPMDVRGDATTWVDRASMPAGYTPGQHVGLAAIGLTVAPAAAPAHPAGTVQPTNTATASQAAHGANPAVPSTTVRTGSGKAGQATASPVNNSFLNTKPFSVGPVGSPQYRIGWRWENTHGGSAVHRAPYFELVGGADDTGPYGKKAPPVKSTALVPGVQAVAPDLLVQMPGLGGTKGPVLDPTVSANAAAQVARLGSTLNSIYGVDVTQLGRAGATGTGSPAAGRASTAALDQMRRAVQEIRVELKSLDDLAQKFGVGVFQSMSKAVSGTETFGKALKGVVTTLGQSAANDFINVGVAGILHPSIFQKNKEGAKGGAPGGGAAPGGGGVGGGLAMAAGQGLTTLLTPMLGAGPAGMAAGAALAVGGALLGGLLGHKKEREEEQFRAHLRALRQAQTEQLMNFTIVLPNGPINPNDPAWKEAVANTMRSVAGTRTGRVEFQTRR